MNNKFDYNNNFCIFKRIAKEAIIPNLKPFIIAIIFMVLGAISIAYRAYLIKPAVDEVFTNKNTRALIMIPLQLIFVAILIGFTTFLEKYLMSKTTTEINISYQRKLFSKFINSDMDYFQNKSSHKILDQLGDISGLMTTIGIILNGLIKQFLTIISLVALMFYQSISLSILAFVAFPLIIYPIYSIGRKLRGLAKKARELSATTNASMGESIHLIKLVKSSGAEEYEMEKFDNIIQKNYKLAMKTIRQSLITSPMMEMAGSIGFAGVIWYGGLSVINGEMTTGAFFTFMTALLSVYKPAKSFAGLNVQIQTALVSARRLFIVLDKESKIKESENAIELKNSKGNIEFKDVKFYYPFHDKDEALVSLEENIKLSEKPALDNINLSMKSGTSVALVGHSGSGKSTIFNLILRFYDANSGKILIDREDIKNITMKSLRENISIVTQDVLIFNASVKENIRYNNQNITDEEIIEACKKANAHEFIENLQDGYDTILGPNGCILSGGQKQRISIARAVIKNSPILLLDEATSALDPISEKLIQKALSNLMKDKTTIIIAHRLTTIQNCDNIFVLENGKLIESGNHENLLEKGGLYEKLYKKQFEKAI